MPVAVSTKTENEPKVEVYGRKDCGLCDRIKSKISKMGFKYEFRIVDEYIAEIPEWRERKHEVVLAGLMMNDDHVPVLFINDAYMTIAKGLKFLKELQNGNSI